MLRLSLQVCKVGSKDGFQLSHSKLFLNRFNFPT